MKIRHKAMGVAAAAILLTVGTAGVGLAASHQLGTSPARGKPAASSFNTHLLITVTNLPSGGLLLLNYGSTVIQSLGGTAQVTTQGAISHVDFLQGSLLLYGTVTTPLSAAINATVTVDDTTVSGTATVPAGATVTVGNGSGTTVPVTNGTFTLPVTQVGSPPPQSVIFSPSGAKDLAITAPATAGNPVQLMPNTGAPRQVWTITSPGNPSYPGTAIVNKQTGLCLDATSQQAKTQVTAATCDGSAAQQWVESKQANGTWQLSAFNYTSPILQAAATIGTSQIRLASPSSKAGLRSWIERGRA